MKRRIIFAMMMIMIMVTNCGKNERFINLPSDLDPTGSEIKISASVKTNRLRLISNSLASLGIHKPALIAGIASAETSLAHCYSEATYHCQGPQSSQCGGPVLAGSGDGACAIKQGGLGMFQFDAGTHSQTLAKYGNGILSVEGNTAAVIPFFVNKITSDNSAMQGIVSSLGLGHINSKQQFIDWVNTINVGSGAAYEQWLRMVACLYNGACPGSGLQAQRIARYREHTAAIKSQVPEGISSGGESVNEPRTQEPATCASKCFIELTDPLNEDPPTVNLREDSSVKSGKITAIPVGTKVCYMGETNANGYYHKYESSNGTLKGSIYYKVSYEGQEGWVWEQYTVKSSCAH